MKKKSLLILLLFFNSYVLMAQGVSCDQLIKYVETNGVVKETVSPLTIQSEWLYSVTAYSIEDKIVVIAEIKKKNTLFENKKYIFCDIPDDNWTAFFSVYSDFKLTIGQRFHKYIFDFTCNCS